MKVKRFRNGLVFVSLLMAVMFFLTFSSTAMATTYTLTIQKATGCTAANATASVTITNTALKSNNTSTKTCSSFPCYITVTSGYAVKFSISGGSSYTFTGCASSLSNMCTVTTSMSAAKTVTFCY